MPLTICNEVQSTISVAIAYYNPNQCANGGKWMKVGWYNIAPGSCRVVVNGNLASVNRNWLYYAHTSDRTLVWAGNYCTFVTPDSFRMCWNEPSIDPGHARAFKVCIRLLDVNSSESYTLRLHK